MAAQLRDAASGAFFDGFAAGCLVAAGVALVGAIAALVLLPAHPLADIDAPGSFADDPVVDVLPSAVPAN